jgi:hypothetical protein
MNIQTPAVKTSHERFGQDAHKTREANEVNSGFIHRVGKGEVECFDLFEILTEDYPGGYPRFLGAFERVSVSLITDHKRDPGIGDPAFPAGVDDSLQVGAASRSQYTYLFHCRLPLKLFGDTGNPAIDSHVEFYHMGRAG